MIFNLVKKDFILIKKYISFLLLFIIITPNFIGNKVNLNDGGFMLFSITVLFALFQVNSTVFTLEEKYNGSILLSATPYTRKNLVVARYIFLASIFIIGFSIYKVMSYISVLSVAKLSFISFATTLLLVSLYLSILLPLQYKLGHVKTRYVSFFIIFSIPFILPSLLKWMAENDVSFTIPGSTFLQGIAMCLIGLLLYSASLNISTKIYAKKNF